MTRIVVLLLFVLITNGCSCTPAGSTGPGPKGRASVVVHNARIYTGNSAGAFVEAIAMRDEKIIYLGDGAGVEAFIDDQTAVHDLGGRLVLPGFHDVHQHTLEAHNSLIDCIVDPNEVDPEFYFDVVSKCQETGGTGWVLGWGYSILTLIGAKRDPRLILDDAFPNLPVAIMEETSHSTWVNSKALEVLGITANTPDPQGGLILRGMNGQPNGLLIDAAGEFPWDHALKPNATLRAANLEALRLGMSDNSKYGITSAVDARVYTERGYLDAYKSLEQSGELTVRMVLSLWASPIAEDNEQIARLKPLFRDDGGRLRIRQIKLYSDGLLQNTTAALLEPYTIADTFGADTGLNYFPEARIKHYLEELQSVGFDAHIHAIGDRAVRESLNAIVAARPKAGGALARHRLTHVELTHPSDVARFAAANVAADMQLASHTDIANLPETAEFIGDSRTNERAWVLGDLWNTGAIVALSSDFDVGELNPFPSITRSLQRGAQSLPNVAAAVRAYTLNGAYIMRSEDRTGSLEVGKFADFIVVDRDIFKIATPEIATTQVLWTVVGSKEVFRREGFMP